MGESVKISVLSKGSKAKRKRGETCGGRTVSNGIVPVAVGKVVSPILRSVCYISSTSTKYTWVLR